MNSQTDVAHPPMAEENGPEAKIGEFTSTHSSQGVGFLRDNCIAGLENKFTPYTKTAYKPGLYPKLAEACDMVDTIDRRQKETWQRLKKLGWTEDKMSGLRNNKTFSLIWKEWVCRPEPPTDEDWIHIQYRLISLLEEDFAAHPERNRERARVKGLSAELNGILAQISTPVEFTIHHPQSSMWDRAPSLYRPPFPSFIHMSNWAIIKDLWETDRTEQEMRIYFGAHRQTIEGAITQWKRGIESHFASLVYIKRGSRAPSHTVQPTLLRFKGEADPFADYTDQHRMLLRGDMLFYNAKKRSSPPIPITYGEILQDHGLIASSTSLTPHSTSLTPQINLSIYEFYLEAHLVARALMNSMQIPKASYHPMVGLGAEFRCERCLDAREVTWVELIRHYIVASETFQVNLKAFRLLNKDIMYRNVHDIDLPINRAMVGFCSINPPQEFNEHLFKRHKCLLCTETPGLKEVVAPEWAIFRHITDVHGISEPVMHLHYNRQRMQEPVYDFGGYGLPPYDSAFI